jgi:MerR family copper efflux transcriptional regulator
MGRRTRAQPYRETTMRVRGPQSAWSVLPWRRDSGGQATTGVAGGKHVTTARMYRIGEVARATGVTAEALRFYEREGLLPTPLRSAAGARRFAADIIDRVRFVKQAQAVGLTLRDIQVLVASRNRASRATCRKIRTVLAARIKDLDQRVREMEAFRTVLTEHLQACDGVLAAGAAADCPTIEAIERSGARCGETRS